MDQTIRISEELAERLRDRKGPNESEEDVVRRLLEATKPADDGDREGGESAAGGREVGADERRHGVAGQPDPAVEADDEVARLVTDVADEVLPESDATAEHRREALQAVVEYLRERETADRSDFERDVYPKHPAGYSERADPARSWWEEAMSEGLAAIADRSDVLEREDADEWRYRGGRER